MNECAGPLFLFDVPADDGVNVDCVALAECGSCGEVFVTSSAPDDRHASALVYRG